MSKPPKVRCAIYTRKSIEKGLDMEFNTLDAQREACENYIKSQVAKGWVCLPEHYDDGGFSGGNINRPALQNSVPILKWEKLMWWSFTKLTAYHDHYSILQTYRPFSKNIIFRFAL